MPEGCVTPRPFAARMCVRRVACRMPPMPPNGSLVHHMSRGRLHGQMHEVRTVVRSFRLPHSCQPALFLPLSHLCMCANVCVNVRECVGAFLHMYVCVCVRAREASLKRNGVLVRKRNGVLVRRGPYAAGGVHDSHAHDSYATLTHTKAYTTLTHTTATAL